MNVIQSVFEISEEFMKSPEHVSICEDKVLETTELMRNSGVEKFSFSNENDVADRKIMVDIYKELIGNAINYCFWYGKHDVRPRGSSSNLMHELLDRCFARFGIFTKELVDYYISLLTEYRFPLLEERVKHLNELVSINEFVRTVFASRVPLDFLFERLIKLFPGYGSDMFLKRASLFFIQLNRRFSGWYEGEISSLPIPADYQVPKMLEHYNCIVYSKELKNKINSSELIPKHSVQECEIRAATVLVSKKLSELTGWSISDVDAWFWLKRNGCKKPFHLTITTDY